MAASAALFPTFENVREWPVDAPVLLLFGLFALLSLASWFGSAIVERLLDTAMVHIAETADVESRMARHHPMGL